MSDIRMNAIILFAKPYRVAEGGTTNEGITVYYLLTDSLSPYSDETTQSQGYRPSKCSIPLEQGVNLGPIPGYYQLDCDMVVGSNNQPVVKPQVIKFLNYLDLQLMDSLTKPAEKQKTAKTEGAKQ